MHDTMDAEQGVVANSLAMRGWSEAGIQTGSHVFGSWIWPRWDACCVTHFWWPLRQPIEAVPTPRPRFLLLATSLTHESP